MAEAIGLISAGLGLGSSLFGASAAESAADTQSAAAREAAARADARFAQIRQDILPFIQRGGMAGNQLMRLTGAFDGGDPLTAPLTRMFNPGDLESSPGFRFARDQGLKAVQNGYAARGLGVSGAALKGAARYATGLADTTYQNMANQDLAQRTGTFNMLMPQASSGLQGATALGGMGVQSTANSNAYFTDAAKAEAAGTMGQANAWAGLMNPLAQYGLMYWAAPDTFRQNIANGNLTRNVYGR